MADRTIRVNVGTTKPSKYVKGQFVGGPLSNGTAFPFDDSVELWVAADMLAQAFKSMPRGGVERPGVALARALMGDLVTNVQNIAIEMDRS